MELTPQQAETIHKLDQFATQDKDRYFYLFGPAGTGKTYLVSRATISLLEHKLIDQAFVCAPTHVALNVLESYFKTNFEEEQYKELMKKIKFLTIHKLLEFKPTISNETGTKVFRVAKESKQLKTPSNKLVIIDECSMISQNMVREIDKYIQMYNLKVIFLGDIAQLRPVSEDKSLLFTSVPPDYCYYIVLDQIMRTKSPSIKLVSKIIREWDPTNKNINLCKTLVPIHKENTTPKSFRLYHKSDDYVNTTWFKYIVKKIGENTMPIILTWRNIMSDHYNQIIRQHIHQTTDLKNYQMGDFLMFNNFYLSSDGENEMRFYTSNVIKIIKIKSKKQKLIDWSKVIIQSHIISPIVMTACNALLKKLNKFQTEFVVDKLVACKIHNNPDDMDNIGKTSIVLTINRSNLSEYYELRKIVQEHLEFFFKKYKSEEVSAILWQAFHKNLIDPYAELNFGYSITTHKAQGSTFDVVLVDLDDIVRNPNIGEM